MLAPGASLVAATNGIGHMAELSALPAEVVPSDGGHPMPSAGSLGFDLENGAGILRRSFEPVGQWRYRNDLRVTDVEPVLAYVASISGPGGPISKEALGRLGQRVRERITRDGAFVIGSATGVFLADVDAPRDTVLP